MVLIGALGDLSRRKLLPALYRLALTDLLPARFTLVGTERKPNDDKSFVAAIREAVAASLESTASAKALSFGRISAPIWLPLASNLRTARPRPSVAV